MTELVMERVLADDEPRLTQPFIQEMVRQLRALDAYGVYDGWSDARVLDPLIMTRERRQAIPVVGDPDEEVMARVKALYNAYACQIEKRTGRMAVPLINITHEGFGRAFVFVGKLVVVDRTLRDVHRFGFKGLEKLEEEGEKVIGKAADLINAHPEVAQL